MHHGLCWLSIMENPHSIALHENKAKLNYICKICNKGFISPSKLKVHQVAHQTTKNFVCNKRGCGKKYKHRSDLVRHVRLYHNKNVKWLKCNLCKYVTRVKSSLKTHMKSHNGGRLPREKKIACPIANCNMKLDGQVELDAHLITHNTGIQAAYICEKCSMNFTNQKELTKHKANCSQKQWISQIRRS